MPNTLGSWNILSHPKSSSGGLEKQAVSNTRIYKFRKHMGGSENGGTPKSSILIGFSIINHPFWGTPIFGNPPYKHSLQSSTEIPASTAKALTSAGWIQLVKMKGRKRKEITSYTSNAEVGSDAKVEDSPPVGPDVCRCMQMALLPKSA